MSGNPFLSCVNEVSEKVKSKRDSHLVYCITRLIFTDCDLSNRFRWAHVYKRLFFTLALHSSYSHITKFTLFCSFL